MNNTTRVRTMGLLTIAGGLVWILAFVVQDQLHPDAGPMGFLAGLLFPLGLLGGLAAALGLVWGGAVRGHRFGQIAVGLLIAGTLILIAGVLTGDENSPLVGIGGITSNIAGLLTGIAVIVAGRWRGWQRYAPLVWGGYGFFVSFLPEVLASTEPGMLPLSLWGLTTALLGIALVTRANEQPAVATTAQESGPAHRYAQGR